MADQGAYHHLKHDVEYAFEPERFAPGILVVSGEAQPVVLGGLRNPGRKSNACDLCKETGHRQKDCPKKNDLQACKNCAKVGHAKSQCPLITCGNCFQQGHIKAACTKPKACKACLKTGHVSRHCPDRSMQGPLHEPKACRVCKSTEHLAANCNYSKCTNCGGLGHIVADCMSGPRTQASAPHTSTNAGATDKDDPCDAPGTWGTADNASRATDENNLWGDSGTWGTADNASRATDENNLWGDSGQWRTADNASGATTDNNTFGDGFAPHPLADAEPEDPAAKAAAEAAAVEAAPLGTLAEDDGIAETLSTRLYMTLSEKHASSIRFQFDGSYNSDNVSTGREHKTAVIAFTHKDLAKGAKITAIDPESAVFLQHVPPAQVKLARAMLASDPQTMKLYHVHFTLSAVGDGELARAPVGLAFYSNVDVGPFTTLFHTARDALVGTSEVSLDFFTVSSDFLSDWWDSTLASMELQASIDPRRAWWPKGRVNPQAGMQVHEADRPTDFRLPKRYFFMDMLEYYTVTYHNLIHELENASPGYYFPTTMRIATFTGGEDQLYYGHIVVPEHTHFRAGATIDVKMLGPNADDEQDWSATLTEPLPFTKANEYACFLYRPRSGQGFVRHPEFEEGVHVAAAVGNDSFQSMREAMARLPGIICYIRTQVPTIGIKRAINTVNHLFRGGDAFAREHKLLLANNLLDLPVVDYFQHLVDAFGQAAVDREIELMKLRLRGEQSRIVDELRCMRAGVLCVQGIGGTGKSTALVELVVLHYRLEARRGIVSGRRLSGEWIVSPINAQLDGIASAALKRCDEEYEKLKEEGVHAHPPVFIRRHMGATEKKVYRNSAEQRRQQARQEVKPPYFEDDTGSDTDDEDVSQGEEATLLRTLLTAVRLQTVYRDSNASMFDSRLRLESLSEGHWILLRAGYVDKDGATHAVADPAKHGEFRTLLGRYASGEDLEADEMERLTLLANVIVKELAAMADGIFMTPDVVSQTRAHKLTPPSAVFHDEAGKMAEQGALAALLFSRPYEDGVGGLTVAKDSHCCHVLFGDIMQPTPTIGQEAELHPFGQQNAVSLFARLLVGGGSTVWLWQQHRSNSDIMDLINGLLPRGRMRPAPGVEELLANRLATSSAKRIFGVSKRVVFISTEGKTIQMPVSKSRYNDAFIPVVWWSVFELLRDGFAPTQVSILAPYTAQVAAHRYILNCLVEWCLEEPEGSFERSLATQLGNVDISTVDGKQGAQADVIILDTTNAGQLGFMMDTTRHLLAVGRARSLLVLIGDASSCYAAYAGGSRKRYLQSAFYRNVSWCSKQNTYINLALQPDKRSAWRLKFDMDAALAEYRSEQPGDTKPIDLTEPGNVPTGSDDREDAEEYGGDWE
jgi:hypothetical protein